MFVFTNVTYEKPGGSENLVFMIAKYLMESCGEHIKIFGSANSYLVKRLNEEGIRFEYYDIDDSRAYLEVADDDVLVLFNNYYGLYRFKACSCRVVLWNILGPVVLGWNNFNFEKKIYGRHLIKDIVNKAFLRFLLKKNALLCMDGSTQDGVEQFLGVKVDVDIVPVPIELSDNIYTVRERRSGGEKINLSYIGRGDVYWKVYPVKKIISDLSTIHHDFVFNIFTSETDLYDEVLLPVLPKNITLKYHLGYYGQRLRDKLVDVSDLNYSMGTSALESAIVGIPTILVDAADADLPADYQYRWLYETDKYSLGYHYTKDFKKVLKGYTMSEITASIIDPLACRKQSNLCWEYAYMNHSVFNTVAILQRHRGYISIKEIVRYTPNMWLKSNAKI